MFKRRPLFLKSSSLALAILFLAQNISWAAPLGSLAPSPAPFAGAGFQIPVTLGEIQSFYLPHEQKTPQFILIQDVHAHPPTQKKIQSVLDYLWRKHHYACYFLEGGIGKVSGDYLRFFSEESLNQKLADSLFEKGELSGAEQFLMHAGKEVEAYGIESPALYRKNLAAYRNVMRQADQTAQWLLQLKTNLRSEGSRILNPKLRKFLEEWQYFADSKGELLRHLGALKRFAKDTLELDLTQAQHQLDYPHLIRLFKVQELETKIDKVAAGKEAAQLSEWAKAHNLTVILSPIMGEESTLQIGKNVLASQNVEGNATQILRAPVGAQNDSTRILFERFYDVASPKGFRFSQYPHFNLQVGSEILREEIDAEALDEEMAKVSEAIVAKLAGTDAEKNFVRKLKDYFLLKNLLSLELTPQMYEEIRSSLSFPRKRESSDFNKLDCKSLDSRFRGNDNLIHSALSFYQLARTRDTAMIQNVMERLEVSGQKKAVLVTGGFHTESLARELKRRNISYVTIRPRIDAAGFTETSRQYQDMMLRNDFPLPPRVREKGEGGKISLARHLSTISLDSIAQLSPDRQDAQYHAAILLREIAAIYQAQARAQGRSLAIGPNEVHGFNQSLAARRQGVELVDDPRQQMYVLKRNGRPITLSQKNIMLTASGDLNLISTPATARSLGQAAGLAFYPGSRGRDGLVQALIGRLENAREDYFLSLKHGSRSGLDRDEKKTLMERLSLGGSLAGWKVYVIPKTTFDAALEQVLPGQVPAGRTADEYKQWLSRTPANLVSYSSREIVMTQDMAYGLIYDDKTTLRDGTPANPSLFFARQVTDAILFRHLLWSIGEWARGEEEGDQWIRANASRWDIPSGNLRGWSGPRIRMKIAYDTLPGKDTPHHLAIFDENTGKYSWYFDYERSISPTQTHPQFESLEATLRFLFNDTSLIPNGERERLIDDLAWFQVPVKSVTELEEMGSRAKKDSVNSRSFLDRYAPQRHHRFEDEKDGYRVYSQANTCVFQMEGKQGYSHQLLASMLFSESMQRWLHAQQAKHYLFNQRIGAREISEIDPNGILAQNAIGDVLVVSPETLKLMNRIAASDGFSKSKDISQLDAFLIGGLVLANPRAGQKKEGYILVISEQARKRLKEIRVSHGQGGEAIDRMFEAIAGNLKSEAKAEDLDAELLEQFLAAYNGSNLQAEASQAAEAPEIPHLSKIFTFSPEEKIEISKQFIVKEKEVRDEHGALKKRLAIKPRAGWARAFLDGYKKFVRRPLEDPFIYFDASGASPAQIHGLRDYKIASVAGKKPGSAMQEIATPVLNPDDGKKALLVETQTGRVAVFADGKALPVYDDVTDVGIPRHLQAEPPVLLKRLIHQIRQLNPQDRIKADEIAKLIASYFVVDTESYTLYLQDDPNLPQHLHARAPNRGKGLAPLFFTERDLAMLKGVLAGKLNEFLHVTSEENSRLDSESPGDEIETGPESSAFGKLLALAERVGDIKTMAAFTRRNNDDWLAEDDKRRGEIRRESAGVLSELAGRLDPSLPLEERTPEIVRDYWTALRDTSANTDPPRLRTPASSADDSYEVDDELRSLLACVVPNPGRGRARRPGEEQDRIIYRGGDMPDVSRGDAVFMGLSAEPAMGSMPTSSLSFRSDVTAGRAARLDHQSRDDLDLSRQLRNVAGQVWNDMHPAAWALLESFMLLGTVKLPENVVSNSAFFQWDSKNDPEGLAGWERKGEMEMGPYTVALDRAQAQLTVKAPLGSVVMPLNRDFMDSLRMTLTSDSLIIEGRSDAHPDNGTVQVVSGILAFYSAYNTNPTEARERAGRKKIYDRYKRRYFSRDRLLGPEQVATFITQANQQAQIAPEVECNEKTLEAIEAIILNHQQLMLNAQTESGLIQQYNTVLTFVAAQQSQRGDEWTANTTSRLTTTFTRRLMELRRSQAQTPAPGSQPVALRSGPGGYAVPGPAAEPIQQAIQTHFSSTPESALAGADPASLSQLGVDINDATAAAGLLGTSELKLNSFIV
ncbi:MAG: hypothetical protein HY586_05975, partial [Candidatus Omnitrophica bacterium]|nr:hypothetical protein [Candidatus Omnitrophota bacterium]